MSKILIFVKTTPVTGATVMNNNVLDSQFLREHLTVIPFPLKYEVQVANLGRLTLSKIIISISTFFRLFKKLIIEKPDCVYFQVSLLKSPFLRDLAFISLFKIFKTKLIYQVHSRGVGKVIDDKPILRHFYKYAFTGESLIFGTQTLLQDIPKGLGFTSYMLANGLPDTMPPITKSTKKSNTHTLKIIYLSNFIESKGIIDFIDIMQNLKDKGHLFKAIIIGGDADYTKQDLVQILKNRKLNECVEVLGAVYGDEKIQHLCHSDLMIFPSYYDVESFPLTLLEALKCSLPVITYAIGSSDEIIQDKFNGYVVKSRDTNSVAKYVESLDSDRIELERLSTNAKKSFEENYTMEIIEERLLKIIQNVLKG